MKQYMLAKSFKFSPHVRLTQSFSFFICGAT